MFVLNIFCNLFVISNNLTFVPIKIDKAKISILVKYFNLNKNKYEKDSFVFIGSLLSCVNK